MPEAHALSHPSPDPVLAHRAAASEFSKISRLEDQKPQEGWWLRVKQQLILEEETLVDWSNFESNIL